VVLSKDTPIFIPGSCVIEKQLDIVAAEKPGVYTRPRIFNDAAKISIKADGSFSVQWRDGTVSQVNAQNVASFAITRG